MSAQRAPWSAMADRVGGLQSLTQCHFAFQNARRGPHRALQGHQMCTNGYLPVPARQAIKSITKVRVFRDLGLGTRVLDDPSKSDQTQ